MTYVTRRSERKQALLDALRELDADEVVIGPTRLESSLDWSGIGRGRDPFITLHLEVDFLVDNPEKAADLYGRLMKLHP